MPYKDPEKAREYSRNRMRKQRENKSFREKESESKKEYYKTEIGIKNRRIRKWKFRGVIHPNFDELYEKYINTEHCELCNIKLTEGKRTHTTRCLDHCHETGEFRNILCHSCNVKRGQKN